MSRWGDPYTEQGSTQAYPNGSYPPGNYPAESNYPLGAYDSETAGLDDTGIVGTSSTKIKLGFLRKVYALLTLCFAVTVGISCVFCLVVPVRNWILSNPIFMFVSYAVGLVFFIVLICFRPKKPWDSVLLTGFVCGFSVMIGSICARYFAVGWGGVVLQAFIATATIFLALTAYVLITRKDFSYLGGFLFAGLIGLFVVSIITTFVGFIRGGVNKWVGLAISIFGALLFTGYILYDTSIILHKLGPDDWVIAVVMLYVDVTNLFICSFPRHQEDKIACTYISPQIFLTFSQFSKVSSERRRLYELKLKRDN